MVLVKARWRSIPFMLRVNADIWKTFSSYARQFLGTMERPEVDKIEGLSQSFPLSKEDNFKESKINGRYGNGIERLSKITFLARASTAFSYNSGEPMVSYTDAQIVELIGERFVNKRVAVLAPVVRARKGITENFLNKSYVWDLYERGLMVKL